MFCVPTPSFLGLVPVSRFLADRREMPNLCVRPSKRASLHRVDLFVSCPGDALQVPNVVVEMVSILVMNLIAFRDRAVVKLPNVPVQKATRAREIPLKVPSRRIRVAAIDLSVELKSLDVGGCFLVNPRHDDSPGCCDAMPWSLSEGVRLDNSTQPLLVANGWAAVPRKMAPLENSASTT